MGHQKQIQNKLFYTAINLDDRIRKDHILRRISDVVDFDFVYNEVKDKYGSKGNVSVPPPVILKLMFLLIFYNVRSERELMETLPERLDWLWFLKYDLDDEIPNHSVLSKARKRWGADVFRNFFDRILLQCIEAGLVDGSKIFMDSSFVQADASNNSVINQEKLTRYFKKGYREFEKRLEESINNSQNKKNGVANKKYISMTDPDAAVTRMGKRRSSLQYKTHRAVDEKNEIITATDVTTGSVNEAHLLVDLVEQHEKLTGEKVEIVVADSKYGTIPNYLACYDKDINAHMDSVDSKHGRSGSKKGIFPPEMFNYDFEKDVFICPAGHQMKKIKFIEKRNHTRYAAKSKSCNQCELKPQCTRSKSGRTVQRHARQADLDEMLSQSTSNKSKRDIKKRQYLMERSFARSTRYGFKRARWRQLWRVQIQEYLTSIIQNIMTLIRNANKPRAKCALKYQIKLFYIRKKRLIIQSTNKIDDLYANFRSIAWQMDIFTFWVIC